MNKTAKIALAVLTALILSSCGVVRVKNSPHYYAGAPKQEGYSPAGTVKEVYYGCSVPGPSYRRMIVYLPPGYDSFGSRRYPVMYLLHGARGHETSWIKKGRVFEITDSLYACGAAKPMILVLPNMNQYNSDIDMEASRLKDAFESFLEIDGKVESAFCRDVVSEIDSLFLTIPDKEHRAIAGLSIGAAQSAVISANVTDYFGSVGLLSPCFILAGKPSGYRSSTYGNFLDNLENQFAGSKPNYTIYIGKDDFLKATVDIYDRYLTRNGLEHEYVIMPGSHKWTMWREAYTDYLCKLFK